MAVVLSGCQCWSPKGGRREKGVVGALLFEVSCPLCCSRPSLGPPDDLSSCSFEGQYAPQGPDTRTNDENTDSSGQLPGVRPTKMDTTYVTQSGGLWVPVLLSKPATAVNRRRTRAEATRRALTFKTRRGGKDCVVLEAPALLCKPGDIKLFSLARWPKEMSDIPRHRPTAVADGTTSGHHGLLCLY